MVDKLNWKAGIAAGVIAGVVFLMLEMVLVWAVAGQSPWGPPRMMAAIVIGKGVLPPPADFNLVIMMVAMMVHFGMSVVLGLVFGWLVSRGKFSLLQVIIFGVVFGLLIYFIGFYLMTPVFPWFAMARGAITIFAHAMFGLVLGWVYYLSAKTDRVDAPTRSVV